MTQRRWTLMVVPHGGAPSRGVSVSERAVRRAASWAAGAGLVTATLVGLLVAQFWTAAAQGDSRAGGGAHAHSVRTLHARLDSLRDTLDAIGKRDNQIRLLAGLPLDSGAQRSRPGDRPILASMAAPASAPGRSPLFGRLLLAAGPDIDRLIHRANALAASFAEVSDSLQRNVERYARIPSIMPTAGWLSSHFTRRRVHPILHIARPHEGIDVSAPMGAPIVAPAAGTVARTGQERGYGLVLEIDHGDGIVTRYAHCSRVMAKPGQRVKRGQVVAAVGNSGLSTGPHLHYEIHVHGKVVDPLTYVLPDGAIPD